MRVLIVGGYGVFGGRLARLLAGEPRLRLIIAGRSIAKAQAFCDEVLAGASCEAATFDRDGEATAQLQRLAPDIVVDASGPFQIYGAEPFRLIEAAIGLQIPYLDLADGSDFVEGVAQFDAAAKAAGVFVLSGVSSFPVLTAAVVRSLAEGLDSVDSIEGGIAPSPYAGVGENVIRAISAYAGKPVVLRRDGVEAAGVGMADNRRYVIRPPGHLPLNSIRFSLVDVPDLRALPRLWPQVREVWMGAGPVPEVLHRMLNGLARLVSLRLLPSLVPFAGLFHKAINVVRWGEHRGGMYVAVKGRREGQAIERSWHIIAEGDDGPLIPSMAAQALVERALAGRPPAPGARAAVEELELDDYDRLFANRTIYSGRREHSAATEAQPLYRRVLGEAFDRLPEPIRRAHDGQGAVALTGRATVERGKGVLARLVAAMVGFPEAGEDVPVTVAFDPIEGGERWRRTFAGRTFESLQTEGAGRWAGLIRERFGPVVAGLAPVVLGDRLELEVRRWSVLGVVMPLALAPRGPAFESVEEGRFTFHVEIGHPWTGVIVRYRGWLE